MSEIQLIEALQNKIKRLEKKVETLESQARERDIEDRAALLQIVANIERRWKIGEKKRKPIEIHIPENIRGVKV